LLALSTRRESFVAVLDYVICGDRDDLHHGQDSDGADAVTVADRLHRMLCLCERGQPEAVVAYWRQPRRCRTRRKNYE
jgi:hypothetical protein